VGFGRPRILLGLHRGDHIA